MMNTRPFKLISLLLTIALFVNSGPDQIITYYQNSSTTLPISHQPTSQLPVNNSPELQFDTVLMELKTLLETTQAQLAANPDQGFTSMAQLQELRKTLAAENLKAEAYFTQLTASLTAKDLSPAIMARHASFVADYQAKYSQLLTQLDDLEAAQQNGVGAAQWQTLLGTTLAFLDDNTPAPRPSNFDPHNLPHRSLRVDNPIPPKLTAAEWRNAYPELYADNSQRRRLSRTASASSALATDPPTAADLAETIEVQFTPEITQLAADLNHNPVEIYNWVHNNIEFVPTWGSIQGANQCLRTLVCNAFDTASLTIALLRVSGIPARYQMGTIEVPTAQFMNWGGGFSDPTAANSLFISLGVPNAVERVDISGDTISIKLEHVWIKAFVDYIPSKGAININGDTWVDLDPSFKQYHFPQPINFTQFLNFPDADTFIDTAMANLIVDETTGAISNLDTDYMRTALTTDDSALFDSIVSTHGDPTLASLLGIKSIISETVPLLSPALPYPILASSTPFASIPESLKHTIDIKLFDSLENEILVHSEVLASLDNLNLYLTFNPATETDAQIIDSLRPQTVTEEQLKIFPANFANLVPSLKVNDEEFSSASPLTFGENLLLEIQMNSPTILTPIIHNSINAGEVINLTLNYQKISEAHFSPLTERLTEILFDLENNSETDFDPVEFEELMFYIAGYSWFLQADSTNLVAAQIYDVISVRYPSVAITFSDFKPISVFGQVSSLEYTGFKMDIDRDLVATISKNGNQKAAIDHTLITGVMGSQLEANIPKLFVNNSDIIPSVFWVGTTPSLSIALELGDPLLTLTPENYPTVEDSLGFSQNTLVDIENELNEGLHIMIHENGLETASGQILGGYIAFDPETGSGAYIINSLNGSEPVNRGIPDQCETAHSDFENGDLIASAAANEIGNARESLTKELLNEQIDTLITVLKDIPELEETSTRLSTGKRIIGTLNKVQSHIDIGVKLHQRISAVPDNAKPLIGLAVMFAGLELIQNHLPDEVPTGVSEVVGVFLGMASFAAYNIASHILGRQIEIELAIQGIIVPPGCIAKTLNLDPS